MSIVRSIISPSLIASEGSERNPQLQGIEAAAGENRSGHQVGDALFAHEVPDSDSRHTS